MASSLSRLSKSPGRTQKLIVFRLRQERFALPIQFAERVMPLGQVYGADPTSGTGLTLYQGRELLVLDVDRLVFQSPPPPRPQLQTARSQPNGSANTNLVKIPEVVQPFPQLGSLELDTLQNNRCLMVLQNDRRQSFGIALSSQPALLRVTESSFMPVPPEYLSTGAIRCISALVVPHPDQPPLFLLNLNSLL